MANWIELVERLGFPIAVCLILLSGIGTGLWVLVRAGRWGAKNLVLPVRDRHFAFLEATERTLDKLASAVESQTHMVTEIRDLVSTEASRDQDFVAYLHQRNHDILETLHAVQLGIRNVLETLRNGRPPASLASEKAPTV